MDVAIVDGYVDEPSGFGVPPYVDAPIRYIAGAVKSHDRSMGVAYFTIDVLRSSWGPLIDKLRGARLLVVYAGITTPGKYLGGTPISVGELEELGRIEGPVKVLGGPVAKFGYGGEGGTKAIPPSRFRALFDLVVSGDVDLVVYELLKGGLSISRAPPYMTHGDYRLLDMFAVRGAEIVEQHPNHGGNLIAEVETYRSCTRWISGGCSFCTTVRYGPVVFRSEDAIVREVEALYAAGVRHFRLGRQADFYAYMARDTGKADHPRPNVDSISRLLHGIRRVAPGLETLHIDNVNPATVYLWQAESAEITKLLVEYGTPGNVAAMGIEAADPRVVKLNNLKVMPEEAYVAVKLISDIGRVRGWNGMPYLLPGINFVAGLPGETKETFRLNMEFLDRLLRDDVWVRRVNIRQVLVFPNTPLWRFGTKNVKRHKRYFHAFKRYVRERFDRAMLARVLPRGTVLRSLYAEQHYGEGTYARQPGSYPILAYIPMRVPLRRWLDVVVVDHGMRSVVALPLPIDLNAVPKRALSAVPGIGPSTVARIIASRPISDIRNVGDALPKGFKWAFTVRGAARPGNAGLLPGRAGEPRSEDRRGILFGGGRSRG